jgi:hypothetical protein
MSHELPPAPRRPVISRVRPEARQTGGQALAAPGRQ